MGGLRRSANLQARSPSCASEGNADRRGAVIDSHSAKRADARRRRVQTAAATLVLGAITFGLLPASARSGAGSGDLRDLGASADGVDASGEGTKGVGQGGALYPPRMLLNLSISTLGSEGDQREGRGELLSSEASAKALLADGEPRCFTDGKGGVPRCLPNAFSIGVSKCGTTSLSQWMSHHPLTRWVPRPGFTYLEAHVFDVSPETWRSSGQDDLRDRLSVEADARHTVFDLDMVAKLAKAKDPKPLESWIETHAVETRPLEQAVEEGVAMATRLAECVGAATASGDFGHGHEVKTCEGVSEEGGDCEEEDGCEICRTDVEPWCNPADYLETNLYDAHVGKSMYALQLSRWFSIFGRDRVKVIFTEDMETNPVGALESALNFFGLDLVDPEGLQGMRSRQEWDDIVNVRHNEADLAKKVLLERQVTPELVQTLRDFFAPHNRALEDLLGFSLPPTWEIQR